MDLSFKKLRKNTKQYLYRYKVRPKAGRGSDEVIQEIKTEWQFRDSRLGMLSQGYAMYDISRAELGEFTEVN